MTASFIHISDIHFGQEHGGILVVHDDVKERIIADAAQLSIHYADGKITGVIVTGDIAYAGKTEEYKQAGEWLDKLTKAIGCETTAVQIVPGNHDIDRDAISTGCQYMLDQIGIHGESKLDEFLATEVDSEVLYNRFVSYRPFAEAYNCPLDRRGGIASDRKVAIADGRSLRFIGLNSALICAKKDEQGKLLLGARQHVLPKNHGEELIVLSHHPLSWLQDTDQARRYIRARARVFVTGHEHKPSLSIENIKPGCDLMTLAAGAAVPPSEHDGYTYSYNLLLFDWDSESDGLRVTIVPRIWSSDEMDFVADEDKLGGKEPTFLLGCPNFSSKRSTTGTSACNEGSSTKPKDTDESYSMELKPGEQSNEFDGTMDQLFPLILLKFFRDLTSAQRIALLVEMSALPTGWNEPLTHTVERDVINKLAREGKTKELGAAIDRMITTQKTSVQDDK